MSYFDTIPAGLADKPAQVDLFNAIRGELEKTVEHYKLLAVDGISLSDVWNLVTSAVSSFAVIAESFGGSGGDKKAVVLAAAETLYDKLIAPLDIPYVPGVIENRIVDPMLKKVFMQLVSGAIDAAVKVLNRTEWKTRGVSQRAGFEPF